MHEVQETATQQCANITPMENTQTFTSGLPLTYDSVMKHRTQTVEASGAGRDRATHRRALKDRKEMGKRKRSGTKRRANVNQEKRGGKEAAGGGKSTGSCNVGERKNTRSPCQRRKEGQTYKMGRSVFPTSMLQPQSPQSTHTHTHTAEENRGRDTEKSLNDAGH